MGGETGIMEKKHKQCKKQKGRITWGNTLILCLLIFGQYLSVLVWPDCRSKIMETKSLKNHEREKEGKGKRERILTGSFTILLQWPGPG